MAKRVLVVDDEELIVKGIHFSLGQDGMEVDCAYDGEEGLQKVKENHYDVVLLDIMLPKMDGFEVCRQIREFSKVPIIMLSAKGEDMDKILGFEYGTDDYITKPFSFDELLIRIKNILKLYEGKEQEDKTLYTYLNVKNLVLCVETREVKVNGEKIDLSQKEFDLLQYMLENKRIVLTREKILQTVWGYDYYGDTNVVDVYIHALRDKIDKRFNDKYIHTERGVGYVIRD